ncbi:MAG TPA: AI-2E family transporter [Ktedonobacteraceae bacterium]|nr:AI-2E family transporter [Ktedonobacteraceae bacterium]
MSASSPPEPGGQEHLATTEIWIRRLIISLTFLAWIALSIIIVRLLSFVATSLLVLVLAALIAYAVIPLVGLLQRVIPRPLAILIVYLLILGLVILLLYLLIVTSIDQIRALALAANSLFQPGKAGAQSPLAQILRRLPIPRGEIDALSRTIGEQLTGTATSLAQGVVPLISGIAGAVINVFLTAVISIYLLIDGERMVHWIRANTPRPLSGGTRTLLLILKNVIGGYVRGQVVLSLLVGLLVGLGMFILRVPYAILLGTLSGFMEFIPVIGTIISGVFCCILALTQGWITFILVLIYFAILHMFEGYILSPRIVGKAVGLHPVVSLLALAAGGELFGPLGAILAAPFAGLLQSVIVSIWLYYRTSHQEQFILEETEL